MFPSNVKLWFSPPPLIVELKEFGALLFQVKFYY